jgi:nucleoside-diphosphate-sugar epimerase
MTSTDEVVLPGRRGARHLVTGVAGFVGSHLAEALLARGHHVVGIDAFTDSYPRWYKERNLLALRRAEGFEFLELDLRTADLDAALVGVDTVFNQAAFPGLPRSWTEVEEYVACNLVAVSRLVAASTRQGVRRFVQASTSSVYGQRAVGDELQSTSPVSPYGMSKLAAEHLLLAHVQSHAFPAVILRYFSIYGPRQRPDMAYHIFIEALRRGHEITVFGDGHQSRSNTFVHDCVDGTIAAAEGATVGEIYNIGGGVPIELGDAIGLIGSALGCPPRVSYAPPRAGDQQITFADTAKALDAFGFEPKISPDQGLTAQVRWHLDVADGDRGAQWRSWSVDEPAADLTLTAAAEQR